MIKLVLFAHVQHGFQWQPYLLAVVSALLGLFGRWLYDYFINLSNLVFSDKLLGPIPQSGILYYRLLVTNKGRGRAKHVDAVVEQVTTDGKPNPDFLPSPLRWTHQPDPVTVRDIQKNQPVYLDLFEYKETGKKAHILRLLSPQISSLENLSHISKGKTRIDISLYQASGQVVSVQVLLDWDGSNPPNVLSVKGLSQGGSKVIKSKQ